MQAKCPQHFPQGRGPGGWKSRQLSQNTSGIGRALKGVSKDRSGARRRGKGRTWPVQAGSTGVARRDWDGELSHGQASRLAGRRWKARLKGKCRPGISAWSQARELDFLPQAEETTETVSEGEVLSSGSLFGRVGALSVLLHHPHRTASAVWMGKNRLLSGILDRFPPLLYYV